jgi:glycosyltransferase involved in cell wall biosynthesis
MRPLIVAPSVASESARAEIAQGKRPRIDYIELSERLHAPYMDYTRPARRDLKAIRSLEQTTRLDFNWVRTVARTVKEQDCDLVISLSERIGMPLAYAIGRGVKHITISHKPLSPHKLALIRMLRMYNRWDVMTTFSSAETEQLRKAYHLGPDRVRTTHWGVDTDFYKPLDDMSADQKPHIFSVGLSNRDYPTLMRAMRKIPHVECHICATSAWEDHSAGLERERLPENVIIKSYNHPLAIREAYAKCRFVVIPMLGSTTQWSAGCTSVLQPQAMARAVVATRLPGLADYLADGESGALVRGGDPAALAEAIDALWQDPRKTAEMGRFGREWVVANRSLEVSVEGIVDIANEVAESPDRFASVRR